MLIASDQFLKHFERQEELLGNWCLLAQMLGLCSQTMRGSPGVPVPVDHEDFRVADDALVLPALAIYRSSRVLRYAWTLNKSVSNHPDGMMRIQMVCEDM